jgi:serine protease Do
MSSTISRQSAVMFSVLAGSLAQAFPDATPDAIAKVTQSVFPAVVRIDVAQERFADGKRTLERGIGSGVIIDEQGRILTNYHVAGKSEEIFITLANKERVRGRLVGDDHWTDLAVIQMDLDEVRKKGFEFAHAELGSSSSLVPGQPVMAIGTPFGLTRTVTLGIVSNTERTFHPQRQDIDGFETGDFSNWIQMDTPIAPGNSGGPLVDMNGVVVGINTRGFQGQDLNFAIPADTARFVFDQIVATATDDKPGRVMRAYIGIDFTPLQDLESFFELDPNQGALISTVDRNSPAAQAGVKSQDILLKINDAPVNIRFPEEIAPTRAFITKLPLGEPATLTIRRGQEVLTLQTTPVKLESKIGQEREIKDWGLSVRDVTRALATEQRFDNDLGVLVTSTANGFPAARAEVVPGDVILRVDGTEVVDLDAFLAAVERVRDAKPEAVLIELRRGRGMRSALMKLNR